MPPKKLLKLDKGQQKVSGFFSSNRTESMENNAAENKAECEEKPVKQRTFQTSWLQHFSWLRYEARGKNDDFMYCTTCTEHNVKTGMNKVQQNRNFQNSTLTRHAKLPAHQHALQIPKLHQEKAKCDDATHGKKDKAITALLKILHWMTIEDVALNKFKSLLGLLCDLGVPDLDIVQKLDKLSYDLYFTAQELLDSLAQCSEQHVNNQIEQFPVVTVLTDKTTDITNKKILILYTQLINPLSLKPSTHYLGNIECKDSTGKGIAESILSELASRGIEISKVVSFGSDGASVMTGKRNGAAALLRRPNPHMTNVHCIAHRIALCSSKAAENIPALKQHQQILTDLFYYFKLSSKRESALRGVRMILDDPILKIREMHSVRWLSYFEALTTVYRSFESVFIYLRDCDASKDPKAAGLKKKMKTDKF